MNDSSDYDFGLKMEDMEEVTSTRGTPSLDRDAVYLKSGAHKTMFTLMVPTSLLDKMGSPARLSVFCGKDGGGRIGLFLLDGAKRPSAYRLKESHYFHKSINLNRERVGVVQGKFPSTRCLTRLDGDKIQVVIPQEVTI